MRLAIGDKITGIVNGDFFAGTVTKLWLRGFVWERYPERTAVLQFFHNEGTTWVRGDATLADRR